MICQLIIILSLIFLMSWSGSQNQPGRFNYELTRAFLKNQSKWQLYIFCVKTILNNRSLLTNSPSKILNIYNTHISPNCSGLKFTLHVFFFSLCDCGYFNTGYETQDVFVKRECCTLHSGGAVKREQREKRVWKREREWDNEVITNAPLCAAVLWFM